MAKLRPEVIKTRLEYAKSVRWDHIECSKAWRISRYAAKCFIQDHRPRKRDRKRPEYENQRMFDLQVMTPAQWCEVWSIPMWEYKGFLRMYERRHGKMATPEIRAEWDRQYWDKLER